MARKKNVKISIVIPVYNDAIRLEKLLLSLKNQSFKDFEVIVVDDCSKDNSYETAKRYADKIIKNKINSGPAITRNKGIKASKSNIIAFIDSDCIAGKDWLKNIYETFKDKKIKAVMGKVTITNSNLIGNAVSNLGFPAGGNLGFDKVWHIDDKGFTDHISSCNAAVRKDIFDKYGVFDESFPLAGAEDTEFSYRLTKNNVKIKYCPDIKIEHVARTSLISFVKWQVYRGRSNYHLQRKIGNVKGFLKLRVWYAKNVLKENWYNPIVIKLLFLSFILQQYGYFLERISK